MDIPTVFECWCASVGICQDVVGFACLRYYLCAHVYQFVSSALDGRKFEGKSVREHTVCILQPYVGRYLTFTVILSSVECLS